VARVYEGSGASAIVAADKLDELLDVIVAQKHLQLHTPPRARDQINVAHQPNNHSNAGGSRVGAVWALGYYGPLQTWNLST